MAHIDDLMTKVDTKFHLVHLSAKRAREINDYYAQLGEGLQQHVPPLVSTPSNKPLSVALEEIAQEKVIPTEATEEQYVDPLADLEFESTDE
ncbi:MAG: DNA-directed RNA polymerase subunit omega [Nitriliruptorales bacterium]|nr:DNA-directed RNA polymerase subunit omega [Nitriliruptorales bacterium]